MARSAHAASCSGDDGSGSAADSHCVTAILWTNIMQLVHEGDEVALDLAVAIDCVGPGISAATRAVAALPC